MSGQGSSRRMFLKQVAGATGVIAIGGAAAAASPQRAEIIGYLKSVK